MKRRYYKRDNLSTSLSGDNLLVFYYLSTSQIWPELPFFIQMVQNYLVIFKYLNASEIWPDKMVVFCGRGLTIGGLLYCNEPWD